MKSKENKSFFLMQFGDTPQLRVLDFLIGFNFFDYPLTEIARNSNVSYNSLKSFFDNFLKSGIVIKTRKVGKSDYYKLNTDNSFIRDLIRLDWNLTKSNLLPGSKEKKVIEISNRHFKKYGHKKMNLQELDKLSGV